MKRTFLDLTETSSYLWFIGVNTLFGIVYDIDDDTIWAGWRLRKDKILAQTNKVCFDLTYTEAQNFNMQIY